MRRALLSVMLPLALAPLPLGWPHHLALGVSDPPGDAQALHSRAGVDMRYQYLAGGVNTGHGWASWNPDGSFVSMYVRESFAAHTIPVFTYYQMLQSSPSVGSSEQARDLSNMRNPATMQAYWADFSLLLRRVAAAAGSRLVVIHVEPDLWGYLEQAHAVGLARSFADHLIALRNRLAPHVLLAWHLSVWGTDDDITNSKPSLPEMDALAAKSAAFYESLHAHFDLVFNDVTDRDADYYRDVEGNPHTWWGPADFARENRYIAGFTARTHEAVVLWQLPLGDSHENDTWNHYRDNRLQWWLGPGSAAHLKATRDAGVIGLLFGAGASGNTTDMTDGGLFYRLARAYESHPVSVAGLF
ncbi:MAG TPA: hypothetical protein VMB27_24070 [Solirubrobacteraceae bacterium]|nr:hypothetical protein [Solirubrobacteraceae bacterium]